MQDCSWRDFSSCETRSEATSVADSLSLFLSVLLRPTSFIPRVIWSGTDQLCLPSLYTKKICSQSWFLVSVFIPVFTVLLLQTKINSVREQRKKEGRKQSFLPLFYSDSCSLTWWSIDLWTPREFFSSHVLIKIIIFTHRKKKIRSYTITTTTTNASVVCYFDSLLLDLHHSLHFASQFVFFSCLFLACLL